MAKAATLEGHQRSVEAACAALSAQEQELLRAVVRVVVHSRACVVASLGGMAHRELHFIEGFPAVGLKVEPAGA